MTSKKEKGIYFQYLSQ